MKVILYARVSSKDQAEEGYSLEDQLRTLEKWAKNRGHEVIERITDVQSGASLVRPGLARVEKLVKAGSVDMVVTQYQDRIAREPAIADYLEIRYEQYGTKLRALNEPEDESPTGALTKGMLRQIAKFDRAMITERTRNGRFARARKGEVIGSGSPPYGFKHNPDRTNFEVDHDTMPTIKRLFELVADGNTLHSVATRFTDEGLPTPGGGKHWYVPSLRRMILNDVYKGTWWYGRNRVKLTPMGEKRRSWKKTERDEWVAIHVPDSGIPHEVIDAARANVENAYRPRKESKHFYELRGMLYCSCCGLVMSGYSTGGDFRYYRCQSLRKFGRAKYPDGATRKAEKLEREVIRYVDSLLDNPEKIRAQLDAAIAAETTRNPDKDAVGWLRIVEECDRQRTAYQDQQAAGYMTLEELGAKLAGLNERKATARNELDGLQAGRRRVEELEATKATLLTAYKDVLLYDGLLYFPPEIRREIYEAMRLKVTVPQDGPVRVQCAVDQNVIKMSRAVEEWAVEEMKYDGKIYSSKPTAKVMAEVAS